MLLRNFYFKKLQGFRSYEGFTGLLLGIFSYVSKVTRLRKIRCFLEIFKKNPKVLKLLTFESHDAFGIFNNLFKGYKVSEVTKFKILQFLYNFSAKKFIITKLQSYEVTTETSVKSIHVSCHIYPWGRCQKTVLLLPATAQEGRDQKALLPLLFCGGPSRTVAGRGSKAVSW